MPLNKLIPFLLALLITLPAHAVQNPQQLVRETSETMLSALADRREEMEKSPALLNQLAEKIVSPHFDFYRISQLALGKHWRKASKEQKAQFSKEFHLLLLRTYSKALLNLKSEAIAYPPVRPSKRPDRITVPTLINKEGGQPVEIGYRLYQKDNGWKVYDVVIDGVSLVSNYRRSFSTQIRKEGLNPLIAALQERNKTGIE